MELAAFAVAVFAIFLAILTLVACSAYTRWVTRSMDRREATYLATIRDLNDRLMFATEKTWTPPPDAPDEHEEREEPELVYVDDETLEGMVAGSAL